MSGSSVPVLNSVSWSAARLVDSCTKAVKSLCGLPEQASSVSFVEIKPYGFITHTYLKYVSGRLEGTCVSTLPDGTRAIEFWDGTIIIDTTAGHVIELDKRRRVVLVRVTRAEAEGAKLSLGRDDFNTCFTVSRNKLGQDVRVMPGNIVISENDKQVIVKLPNGTELFASKKSA